MATTLEELVVKLEAQNKDFIQQMTAAQVATSKALDSMAKSVKEFTDTKKEVSGFQRVMEIMTGNVLADMAVKAATMAKDALVGLFNTMVVDGVTAAAEAEESVNRLNFSLAQAGEYSRQTSKEFQDWASQLQSTTKYSDDAILKNAALIESMAKLDKEGLKQATQSAMNLSSALGIDLETATRMVGKAATGEVSSFKRYGIEIEETASKTLNYANALKAIEKLGPAASAEANTFSGSIKILGNAFNDVQEAIGFTITQNPVVVAVMKELGAKFQELSKWVSDNSLMIRQWVGAGITLAINATTLFIASLDQLARVGTSAFNLLVTAANAIVMPIASAMHSIGMMSDETWNSFKKSAEDTAKGVVGAFTEDTALGSIGVKLSEIGLAADKAFEQTAKGAIMAVEPVNSLNGKTQELSITMQELIRQGKELAEGYVKSSMSAKSMVEQTLKDHEITKDMAMERAKEEERANVFAIDSTLKRHQAEIEAQHTFFDQKNEALIAQQESEQAALVAALENKKITDEQYAIAEKQMRDKYDQEGRKVALDRKKFDNTIKEQELAAQKAQVNALAGLQDSQNAYAKQVGKAAAVAQTIMNTQTAAQGAYSALASIPYVGPFLGAAAAAAVIADGATRLGIIRGAKGGIDEVPGIGTNDTFGPVALAPGERVVPGETNKDLKAAIETILSGGGGGTEKVVVEIRLNDQAMEMIEAKLIERQRLNTASA